MNNQNPKDYANNIKNQADKIGSNFEKSAQQAGDHLETFASQARDSFENAGENLQRGFEKTSGQLRKVNSQFEVMVKSNPLLAVGVAAGLGWAIGRFLTLGNSRDRS